MSLVYGIGINDSNYPVKPTIDGRILICPFYQTWKSMLSRCYSTKYLQRRPTYKDCQVCKEWLTFSSFKVWMENQDWKDKQLDKDILGDGKLYSPETCCFVENWLNCLISERTDYRGKYPLGVTVHRNKFLAQMRVNGRTKYLGIFDDPHKAHLAYVEAKIKHVGNKLLSYSNERVRQAVLEKIRAKQIT